ncbi:MAG: trypsin-like serine protease [Nannocystaceae bacterium]
MSPRAGVPLSLFAAALLGASPAAGAELSNGDPEPQGIYGGQDVDYCAWPTAVAVSSSGGLCTGTLVSPWVVVYAAHCGGGVKKLKFGEHNNSPTKVISGGCTTYPGYGGVNDQAHDWAYCVLDEAVRDLPVSPVLFGCETSVLGPGKEVAIVGFGANEGESGAGRKRWAMTTLNQVGSNTATLGGNGLPSVCPGDSGGPAFIDAGDGVWRAFGIASTVTGGCGGVGTHALIHRAVQWIEEDSGYDITPCHDGDGTWNPTLNCGGFFAGGAQGYGTWGPWCDGTPKSASSDTCGQPFDAIPDNDAPLVEIAAPGDGDELPSGSKVDIEIAASDGDGWGVKVVRLKINGEEQPTQLYEAPYMLAGAAFPDGVWTLQGIAEDAGGLIGESEEITFIIGDPPLGTTGGDETTGGTDGTTGSDTGTTGGTDAMTSGEGTGEPTSSGTGLPTPTTGASATGFDMEPEDDGCGCRSGAPQGPLGLVLLGLALPLLRRRRS